MKYALIIYFICTTIFSSAQNITVDPLSAYIECSSDNHALIDSIITDYVNSSAISTDCQDGIIHYQLEIDSSDLNLSPCGAIIELEFLFSDNCGNEEVHYDDIYIDDSEPPVILDKVYDLEIPCTSSLIDSINYLIANNFGMTLVDNCQPNPMFLYFTIYDEYYNEINIEDIVCGSETYEIEYSFGDDCFEEIEFISLDIIGTVVSFKQPNINIGENNSTKDICLVLDDPHPSEITTATIELIGGQAQSGTDFVSLGSSFEITFAPGESEKCFAFTTIEDEIIDKNEYVQFSISEVTGGYSASIKSPSTNNINIIDNDDNDNDGINTLVDNCPNVYNPEQLDIDDDGIGNLCDDENTTNSLLVIDNDVFLSKISSGVVIRSQNGKCWKLVVNNTGQISTFEVVCP